MKLHQHRVLIVEDEIFIAMEVEAIVRDAGGEVVGPAMSTPQALLLIENHEITVAILDVQLGGQNSLPVARRLKNAGIPFVFHTGNEDNAISPHTWPGAPIVKKPATLEALVAAIVALKRE